MKKFYLLFTLFTCVFHLPINAQVPNGSFENWNSISNYGIHQWMSFGKVSPISPSVEGNYAVKLEYGQSYGGTAFILHGNYVGGIGFIGGVPYDERPDSISGFFKCFSPDPTDAALMLVIFRKNGADLSTDYCFIPTNPDTSQFIRRSYKVNFTHPTETPDSVIIIMTNPRPFQDTVYSGYLIADDIQFVSSTAPIPNGNFEGWNIVHYEDPQQWATYNNQGTSLGQYPVSKTADSYLGSFAAKIENIIQGSDTIAGVLKSSLSGFMHNGAFPLAERITGISCNIKFSPQSADSATIVMLIYHNDTVAGYAFGFLPDELNTWTDLKLPVHYTDNFIETPDSAVIHIASYNLFGGSPKGASVLVIDNIRLETNYNLKINEIQSSNLTTHFDEMGDAVDWIEIYNAGSSPVNLINFHLSDNVSNPQKWKFPGIVIEPDSFLIIHASGKQEQYLPLHANFKISSQGEDILLSSPTGEVIDHIEPKLIPTDLSYGSFPDGSANYGIFSQPTPGKPNTNSVISGFTNEVPLFSHQGGFYSDSILLTLSTTHSGAEIRYTLDGSEPTQTSTVYTSPILIKSRAGEPNGISMIDEVSPWWEEPIGEVFKSTIVRAKLFIEDTISLKSATHTFFVDDEIFSKYNMPVISIVTDNDNLFDYERGIYVKGKPYYDWIAEHPDSVTLWIPGNYFGRGDQWERSAHLEFYEKDGTHGFSTDIGLRVHGGASRMFSQKSLRFYFRDKYGNEEIDYPIFPGLTTRAGNFPLTKFHRLLLRNSGNDFGDTGFRDGMIHRLVGHVNQDCQDIRPVAVFINGEYWGIQNLRERQDKYYTQSHYHFSADEVNKLETMGFVTEGPSNANEHFGEMYFFAENNDLSQQSAYDYIKTMMDIDNFIDHQSIQIFVRNTDWPGNNISFWRRSTSQYVENAPYGQDGRWRWQLFDTDFGFGLQEDYSAPMHNTLIYATDGTQTEWPNPAWSTLLLRKLLDNEGFKHDFINRMADHLNSSFKTNRMIEVIDSMQQIYITDVDDHMLRWFGPSATMQKWMENVNIMRYFAQHRSGFMYDYYETYFGLPGRSEVTLDVSSLTHGYIKISSIDINEKTIATNPEVYPWEGVYFQDVPIPVQAIPKPGHKFIRWEGTEITEPEITIMLHADTSLKAIFEYDPYWHKPLYINELMASNNNTIHDENGEYDDWIEIFNPGTDTLDLAGYYITDNLQQPFKHQIPTGSNKTKISPRSFLILWADGQTEQGPLHLPFKLSAQGETIGIYKAGSYEPVDSVSFGQNDTDISWGRYPDGNTNWIWFARPTPGSSNILPTDPIEEYISYYVYPSPATDVLFMSEERDVQIFNILGELVYESKNTKEANIKHFNSGVYIIYTNKAEHVKFIKL
jgi:hypothetical protein